MVVSTGIAKNCSDVELKRIFSHKWSIHSLIARLQKVAVLAVYFLVESVGSVLFLYFRSIVLVDCCLILNSIWKSFYRNIGIEEKICRVLNPYLKIYFFLVSEKQIWHDAAELVINLTTGVFTLWHLNTATINDLLQLRWLSKRSS